MAVQDVVSELNRLKDIGLITDYAIGGAIAAFAYIEPSATSDIDIFVMVSEPEGSSLAPLQKVWAELVNRGAKVDKDYLVIGGWHVQLLGPGNALNTDAILNARDRDIDGQTARFMGPEHLVAIALELGRAKDYGRIEEFIKTGKVDMQTLIRLLERFGLLAKWKTFEMRFLTNHA